MRVALNEEKTRAEGAETSLSNTITATAEQLTVKIRNETTRAEKAENSLSTDISALAGKIVLKVRSNGEMATVRLDATPESGSLFEVKAKNINMTADDIITFMAGGTINLTSRKIKIKSDNWDITPEGNVTGNNAKFNNVECKNIKAFSISSSAKSDFNSEVSDSEAMKLARQAISNAADAAKKAQSAADAAAKAAAQAQSAANVANTTVNNLVNTVIPDLNRAIQSVSNRVSALESK